MKRFYLVIIKNVLLFFFMLELIFFDNNKIIAAAWCLLVISVFTIEDINKIRQDIKKEIEELKIKSSSRHRDND